MVTLIIIALGLLISVGGALLDAYQDFRKPKYVVGVDYGAIDASAAIYRQIKNGMRLELVDYFRIVPAPPYDWAKDAEA